MIKYFEYGELELDYLSKKDKKLGVAIDSIGIIKREINPDIFSALVENIAGQQISNKAAATVCRRLRELSNMESAKICALPISAIQSCGMSTRKASYIKGIAEYAANKIIDFDNLHNKTDSEIIKILTGLNGVGIWTVEMALIFSLMRPNIVSYSDLAIRRGMINLYNLKELPKERFLRYAKRYSPYGSVASLYLWELYERRIFNSE